jgi:hypothetical protein
MANITKRLVAPINANEVSEYNMEFGYEATGTAVLEVSKTRAAGTSVQPKQIYIENISKTPIGINIKLPRYEATGVVTANYDYPTFIIKPGEFMFLPTSGLVSSNSETFLSGTDEPDFVPTAQTDSGVNLGAHITLTTDPLQIQTQAVDAVTADTPTEAFRVGDFIELGSALATVGDFKEVLQVKSIDSSILMTCYRGLKGTEIGERADTNYTTGHSDGASIKFSTFNHLTDVNTSVITGLDGKFTCSSFFGRGRSTNFTGILPGSITFKFYEKAYQEMGFTSISKGSETGLTASATYVFGIILDGGSATDISFTTDSSNLRFGGANGIIAKMQNALNSKFTDATSALFEKSGTINIINGDLRIISNSRKTTSSVILSDQAVPGTTSLLHASTRAGRFPLIANVRETIPPRIPDDSIYDQVTGDALPNSSKFATDDGFGNISGVATGVINYDSGAFNITGPANSSFVVSCAITTPHAGAINSNHAYKKNGIKKITMNCLNRKTRAKVKIKVYS